MLKSRPININHVQGEVMSNFEQIDELRVVGVTPWDELEGMLRDIPLLGQQDTRPYANAEISLERFKLSELSSTTRYIQEDLLAVQGMLRNTLLSQGHDQLDLRAGRLTLTNATSTVRLAPPIVERYESDGMHKYILDGSHRTQLARQLAEQSGIDEPELTVVYVRNGISYPPYARPNLWEEVHVVTERPADKSDWKNYRDFSNRYALYRDYDGVFDSGPRGLDEASN
jgi:hypothetical protein